jgi:hypothetical protein
MQQLQFCALHFWLAQFCIRHANFTTTVAIVDLFVFPWTIVYSTGTFVVAFVGILQQVVVILHKQLCKNGKFGTM